MEIFLEIAKQYGPFIAVCTIFIWFMIKKDSESALSIKAERDRLDAINKELVEMIRNDTAATAAQASATAAHTVAIQNLGAKLESIAQIIDKLERRIP